MNEELRKPTPELLKEACKEFGDQNSAIEEALGLLFNQYRTNTVLPEVLLKVVALNGLYSTQIWAVGDVADHIQQHAEEIDSALASGSPEIVHMIAKVKITATGKERNNYSFATKYCSWHRPEKYPIWDSRVHRYLLHLQKRQTFAASFKADDLWNYPKFRQVVIDFRNAYGLNEFSFKQTDKFLWAEGTRLYS